MAEHLHDVGKNLAAIPALTLVPKKNMSLLNNSTVIKKSPDTLQQDFKKITRKHLWNQLDFPISDLIKHIKVLAHFKDFV